MSEYPKWLRAPGHADTLVDGEAAEAEVLAVWVPETPLGPNALLSQLDHDHNGAPGGSPKGDGDELPTLRIAYKAKLGKRAFPGWNAAEVKARIEAAE